ncbi:metallophosphoesterase [Phyllobacterium sp. 0TCS1.6C]|uniref:metallophosphoesterase family protein n=1 Tax=unclassified Phyllobacterium TaxID=2638441 RepID=UPI0022641585|nr:MULTISPECIES: metallophosphoesterase [unclassified Phyllobacterium]MCX8280966.1 metallophosphoesterase [Phyllobacterium sp. 0TCS1.6C]MCX8295832.1 metallophosphoesterase [Phyllobacterium sp. 0TCS1.6A]
MTKPPFPPIAVIADAHYHDLHGDYDFEGIRTGKRRLTARRLTDTMRSTRVFNESFHALRATLDDIASRGVRHVVLLGDYSDDGQRATLAGLQRLLETYSRDHGLIFYAVPGNHDIFGPAGRHHGKRFLGPDGNYAFVASTGDFIDDEAHDYIVTDKMFCPGYPEGLELLANIGFFKRDTDLHWECPFGLDDSPAARRYTARSPDGTNSYGLVDGSYLVEPVPDLWLLMLDANIFEPRDGAHDDLRRAFDDSSDAGWNAALTQKPFLFDWIGDVTRRARELGKRVLAFSHYPMIDMLDGTGADEMALLGETGSVRRTPRREVAEAAMTSGLGVHFSGHLHVNDTAAISRGSGFLVNIGMPSIAAFPAAYKIIDLGGGDLSIRTVALDHLPLDADLQAIYRKEIAVTRRQTGHLLEASDYGEFLSAHIAQTVTHRYLKREWPAELARIVKEWNVIDLFELAGHTPPRSIAPELLSLPVLEMIGDWYRLRMGSEIALDWIAADRLDVYRALIDCFADLAEPEGVQLQFSIVMRMMQAYLAGQPSRNFRIDLTSGNIVPLGDD